MSTPINPTGGGGPTGGSAPTGGSGPSGGSPTWFPSSCEQAARDEGINSFQPTACSQTTTLRSETLIADFECFDNPGATDLKCMGELSEAWLHGYYTYANDDPAPTQPWTRDQVTLHALGLDSPGHLSETALHLWMTKPPENWGCGLGIWYGSIRRVVCIDASAFQGISFWAKGRNMEGTISVSIGTFDTVPYDPENDSVGGCSLGDGCSGYDASVTLTPDWTQTTLFCSDFHSDQVGAPPLDGTKLMGSVNFHLPTWAEQETIELWVDDIEFIGGTSEIPRACSL